MFAHKIVSIYTNLKYACKRCREGVIWRSISEMGLPPTELLAVVGVNTAIGITMAAFLLCDALNLYRLGESCCLC